MISRHQHSTPPVRPRRLARDTRGAVFIEYAVLIALVAFVLVTVLLGLGPTVIAEYSSRRATLYSHAP